MRLFIVLLLAITVTSIRVKETRGTITFDESQNVYDNKTYINQEYFPFPFNSYSPGDTKEWVCYHRISNPRKLLLVVHGTGSSVDASHNLISTVLDKDRTYAICGINMNSSVQLIDYTVTFVVHTLEAEVKMLQKFVNDIALQFVRYEDSYSIVTYSAGSSSSSVLASNDRRVRRLVLVDPVDCPDDLSLSLGIPSHTTPGLDVLVSNGTDSIVLVIGGDKRYTGFGAPGLLLPFTYEGCDARKYRDILMNIDEPRFKYLTYAGATHILSEGESHTDYYPHQDWIIEDSNREISEFLR